MAGILHSSKLSTMYCMTVVRYVVQLNVIEVHYSKKDGSHTVAT